MIDGHNNDLNKQGAPRPTLTPVGQFKPDGATFTATLEPIPLLRDALFWQGLALLGMTVVQVAAGPAVTALVGQITSAVLPALGVAPGPVTDSLPGAGLSPYITGLGVYLVKQARADIQHGVPSLAGRLFARRPSGCLRLDPSCSWTLALAVFILLSIATATSGCTYRVAGLEGAVAKIATGHGGFCTADVQATVRAYNPDAKYVVDCPTECPATMTAFTVVAVPVCTVYEAK